MTKKRQQDFGRTQLRPGRTLSKRQNITRTNFKAKKMIMPKRDFKVKSEITIPDCLKKIRKGGSERDRATSLNELVLQIRCQTDSLSANLLEILDATYKGFTDYDNNVRSATLQVFITVLENTEEHQIHTFVPLFTNVLIAAMTHSNHKIKSSSLLLLDCFLKNHPKYVTHNMSILDELVPMAAEIPKLRVNSQTTPVLMENEVSYSQTSQINVLGHINALLIEMLKNKSFPQNDREVPEIYFDGKKPLYLPLFAGSGTKPLDIEKLFAGNLDTQNAYFDESGSIEQFIDNVVKLIPGFFVQIIGGESKSDDNVHRRDTITDLSILFQVLSNVVEWATLISYDGSDSEIQKFLKENIADRNRFPFEMHSVIGSATTVQPLVLLNLSLCHLIAKFLQPGDCDENYNGRIVEYVKKVLNYKNSPVELKFNCIPVLVKMMKIYFKLIEVPEVVDLLHTTIDLLASMLKHRMNVHPNSRILVSLFITMSLDTSYSFVINSNAMKKWFVWLLKELKDNPDKIDRKLLPVIKKIANRKYSSFLENLEISLLKSLLRQDDPEIRDTAMFLLSYMEMDEKFLESISKVFDRKLNKQCGRRLIHLLTIRFLDDKDVNEKDFVHFTLFLLNIAVDCYNLNNEKFIDFDANKYSKAFKEYKDTEIIPIIIHPSLQWKEHAELFEVCFNSLKKLPAEYVNAITMEFLTNILQNTTCLPMHCAIAILKLKPSNIKVNYDQELMDEFILSCLLTTCILTYMGIDDEWYRWNVQELMLNIEFNERTAHDILALLGHVPYGELQGIMVFHILRIIKVFLERNLLDIESKAINLRIRNTIHSLESRCSDPHIQHQPLYQSLIYHLMGGGY